MRVILCCIIVVLCQSVSLLAENNIKLSGTIKDSDGAALENAYIYLASDSTLRDTTGSDGAFMLTNVVGVAGNGAASHALRGVRNMRIIKNRLHFTASADGEGMVFLYSGNGRLLHRMPMGTVESGEQRCTLPVLSSGLYLFQIETDNAVVTAKLVYTGTALFLSETEGSGSRGMLNGRPKAVAAAVDTLIAEKEDYPTVKYPVASYQEEGIGIVMDNSPVYAYAAEVENTSADCPVPELPDAGSLTKSSEFPDPFKKLDGERISKKSEWPCRRQEILAQAMKYIYGDKPAPPEEVTGSVTNEIITVNVQDNDKEIEFTADVKLPSGGEAPYSAIIAMGYGSEVTSKASGLGVAVITYNYGTLGKEQQPEGNVDRNRDFEGLFYDMYGGKHSAGLLMAWAWGASRIIDVLQKYGSEIIDYRRLAVTGCSRAGKAAFAVGLFDERMALTIPQETSLGGMVGYRVADANCPEKTESNFRGQLWFSNNFKPFVSNTSLLPIDAHALIATIAPRGFYGLENSSSMQMAQQMCPGGGNMAVQGAEEVFNALGCTQSLNYNSQNTETNHCGYSDKATESLTACINKFLLHKTVETGKIEAVKTYTRGDWIDWEAPPLEDDTDLYGEE